MLNTILASFLLGLCAGCWPLIVECCILNAVLILYIVLVLSTLAVVGVAWICYRHILHHLQASRMHRHAEIAPRAGVEPGQGRS